VTQASTRSVVPPPPAEPLGIVPAAVALGTEAARIARQLWRTRRAARTSQVVAAEYDGGYWADVLEKRQWERCASLREFLVPSDDGRRIARIENRLVRVRNEDYYDYRWRLIREIVTRHAPPGTPIVEVGSGYGANLFTLADTGRWPELTGLDFSENAIRAGRLVAQRFGLEGVVRFDTLDLLQDDAPGWQRLNGAYVFSYYAFEQMKAHTAGVLRRIIAAKPARVMHIEPTPELWSLLDPRDAISRAYAWSLDYQDNLLLSLRALADEGAVEIQEVRRLFYAPSVRHDPTLIRWEPRHR
jgi:hypothetical protein